MHEAYAAPTIGRNAEPLGSTPSAAGSPNSAHANAATTYTQPRYTEQRYCDRTCRDIANLLNGQQSAASLAASDARASIVACPIMIRSCLYCDGLYVARPGRGKLSNYCSTQHRLSANRPISCEIGHGTCPECGTLWCATRGCGKIYCTERCRRQERERRRGHRKHAVAVFERDAYTCWLCGKLTSKRWDARDPLSPTLDHLIPQSLGGTDDPDNLGTAHAICNSTRGARMITALPIAA